MQYPGMIASTLLLVISVITASAADQSVWDQCNQTGDTDASITACTQILHAPGETASDRAIAYFGNRGCAYNNEGSVPLSRGARERIAEIVREERRMGCND